MNKSTILKYFPDLKAIDSQGIEMMREMAGLEYSRVLEPQIQLYIHSMAAKAVIKAYFDVITFDITTPAALKIMVDANGLSSMQKPTIVDKYNKKIFSKGKN